MRVFVHRAKRPTIFWSSFSQRPTSLLSSYRCVVRRNISRVGAVLYRHNNIAAIYYLELYSTELTAVIFMRTVRIAKPVAGSEPTVKYIRDFWRKKNIKNNIFQTNQLFFQWLPTKNTSNGLLSIDIIQNQIHPTHENHHRTWSK